MSWADYTHIVPELRICDTCALKNFKVTLDFLEDEYDETDLLTLERGIDLLKRLNEKDGVPEADFKYAPVVFEPESGMTCISCGKEAA